MKLWRALPSLCDPDQLSPGEAQKIKSVLTVVEGKIVHFAMN